MTAIALTIAGSDSSGGAGIQADLKTFAALGRLRRLGDRGADRAEHASASPRILDVPADFIAAQIDAVFSDLAIGAVKIGMLSRPAAIEAVARGLVRHKAGNIVLDPVMVATSGDRLLARRRGRRAAPAADPARVGGDAQSAGSRRARRRARSRATRRRWKCRRARSWRSARATC